MKVFVYGSLLSGLGNHSVLGDSEFLGEAETTPEYTMISLSAFPGVLDSGSTAIKGEVYEVNDRTARRLDTLEGADLEEPEKGFYRRHVTTLANGEEVTMYLLNDRGNYYSYTSAVVGDGDWRTFYNANRRRYRG